jgi:integrase
MSTFPVAPFSTALCAARAGDRGQAPPFAASSGALRWRRASGAGSRRILRHAHALELAREGVALNIIQRQLGHANLGTTSIYLQGSTPRRSSLPCGPAARR